ncbi:MAG: sigma-70 family RNA polymerase sigma factor [Phycisphaeraceae bacterium]|nr:sigma-70 family RNA polymerase sigma factor [Phycisphaeraceae bacterium]
MTPPGASYSVLDRVAQDAPGASEALLDRYGGLVWSLARRFCRDNAEAEDAVQDIFLDVWRSARAGRFDPSKGTETTFVAMIARRRLLDRLRRRSSGLAMQALSEEGVPAAGSAGRAQDDDALVAAEALASLSESQQTAIRMSIMQGYTHEQVAQATGMPLGTVKTHIRRGLIRLRDAMAARREVAS